jgi:hypothetical protein
MLQQQRRGNADKNPNKQTDGKHQQKHPNALEQTSDGSFLRAVELPRCLKHDDSHRIVQYALAKNNRV